MLLRMLTLICIAALAIGTWILSAPGRNDTPKAVNQQSMPGYYLKDTVMTDYDATGAPNVKIAAEKIEQIGQSSEVALFNVRLDYQAPGGQSWLMLGDRAQVQPGGKIVDIFGNVRLQGLDKGRNGPALIRTDKLTYDANTSQVTTDSDVRIEFGRHALLARGLIARLKERTMRLESRVNGHFNP